MASASAGNLKRHLGRLFGAGSPVGLTDRDLLERCTHGRDDSAEAAFETILARHGVMVLSVCRHVLGDEHAAEDAFQATFLVLFRRAGSLRIRAPGSLGPWLYGVAHHIASKARRGAARRWARERRVPVRGGGGTTATIERDELRALLHEEVNRLPAKYRAAVVLCYFEGRTHDEAAAALQWPVGTVRGRLARARELLRVRLTRRGLAPSGWPGAILIEPIARFEPPSALVEATVGAAIKGMPATAVGVMAGRALRGLHLARLRMTGGVIGIALMMAGFGLAVPGAPKSQDRRRSETTPRADTTARFVSKAIDRRADPLPEHARLRIGSTGFNHGISIGRVLCTPDGKSIVAIDRTGAVLVWDAATGQLVRAIGGPPIVFRDIALAPDGLTLATLETFQTPGCALRLWDLDSGRERRRWHEVPGYPMHLTFSPDGRTLAAELSTQDPTTLKEKRAITLWDLTSPTERRRQFVADWRVLNALAFTPDSKALITGSNDFELRIADEKPERGSLWLWDVATGQARRRFPVEGPEVRSIAVSPNGSRVAASISDQTIRVFDMATGQERTPRLVPRRAPGPPAIGKRRLLNPLVMSCLVFSPDGSILASGASGTGDTGSSQLADVYFWDVARAKELRHLPAHQGWVRSLSFSPDGRTLASTGSEPMIRLWDVADGREVFTQSGHRSAIRNLVVSPTDSTVVTAGQDGTIRHWETAAGRELGVIARFADSADTMAIAPDGKTLLLASSHGGRFALWSVAEQRELLTLPRINPRNPVRHVAFSPDGKTVASEWRVWDVATGQVLVTFRDPDEQKNRDANFFPIFYSPDGTKLITTESEGARIWDIRSGKQARWAVRAKIHHSCVALSPDGRYLATGGLVAHSRDIEADPQIHLWELASGEAVATLEGHRESTRGLAFSPDSRWLASCSGGNASRDDQTVRIWDVATGRELRRFHGHLGAVNEVAFTPDGRSVVSGSADSTVLVWDVSDLPNHRDAQPVTDERLRTWWAELAGNDAMAANCAGWALGVPSAIEFLRERLQPATSADPEGIPAVNGPIAPPDVLRTVRAIAALERAGTPEARDVLERMAGGNSGAIESREAKGALSRLTRRGEAPARALQSRP